MFRLPLNGLAYTALAIFVTACGQSNKAAGESACAARKYQEQGLILDKSWKRTKTRGIGTNFIAFHANVDSWLIEGFVSRRDRKTLRLEKRPVESAAGLDPYTSFLVIVAPEDFKTENVLSKYFEGNYRHININAACPIYVGKRNGEFALATLRSKQMIGGNDENYRECAIASSLAYFGLPDSELTSFENYVKPDLLPTMWLYDTEKIRSLLLENTNC